jgi:hypothetical protein
MHAFQALVAVDNIYYWTQDEKDNLCRNMRTDQVLYTAFHSFPGRYYNDSYLGEYVVDCSDGFVSMVGCGNDITQRDSFRHPNFVIPPGGVLSTVGGHSLVLRTDYCIGCYHVARIAVVPAVTPCNPGVELDTCVHAVVADFAHYILQSHFASVTDNDQTYCRWFCTYLQTIGKSTDPHDVSLYRNYVAAHAVVADDDIIARARSVATATVAGVSARAGCLGGIVTALRTIFEKQKLCFQTLSHDLVLRLWSGGWVGIVARGILGLIVLRVLRRVHLLSLCPFSQSKLVQCVVVPVVEEVAASLLRWFTPIQTVIETGLIAYSGSRSPLVFGSHVAILLLLRLLPLWARIPLHSVWNLLCLSPPVQGAGPAYLTTRGCIAANCALMAVVRRSPSAAIFLGRVLGSAVEHVRRNFSPKLGQLSALNPLCLPRVYIMRRWPSSTVWVAKWSTLMRGPLPTTM